MKEQYLTPAAILAQSILNSVADQHSELTVDIVASAFRAAYDAVEKADVEHSGDELKDSFSSAI